VVKQIGADRSSTRHAAPPALGEWAMAGMSDYTGGSSARFASIEKPLDLTRLGSPYGYGWYRATIKSPAARKVRAMFPQSADRLHLWADGHALGAVGYAAADDVGIPLRKSTRLVALAENLGRLAGGAALGESKGLFGPVWAATPIKLAKPKMVTGEPVELLKFKSPLWEVRQGDTSEPDRLTWTLAHRKKTGVIVRIDPLPARAILLLNDKPIRFLDRGGTVRLVLEAEQLVRGNNSFQISFLAEGVEFDSEGAGRTAANALHLADADADLSAKAEWAFAKWEAPAPSAYAAATKAALAGADGPTWWRTSFRAKDRTHPLLLDLSGMTKGQVYMNGHHLGRYWVAAPVGGPATWQIAQTRWYLPECWLRDDEDNELVLFDEQGGNPGKCRLVHDERAGPIRA
jgi:hypothetical protein